MRSSSSWPRSGRGGRMVVGAGASGVTHLGWHRHGPRRLPGTSPGVRHRPEPRLPPALRGPRRGLGPRRAARPPRRRLFDDASVERLRDVTLALDRGGDPADARPPRAGCCASRSRPAWAPPPPRPRRRGSAPKRTAAWPTSTAALAAEAELSGRVALEERRLDLVTRELSDPRGRGDRAGPRGRAPPRLALGAGACSSALHGAATSGALGAQAEALLRATAGPDLGAARHRTLRPAAPAPRGLGRSAAARRSRRPPAGDAGRARPRARALRARRGDAGRQVGAGVLRRHPRARRRPPRRRPARRSARP